MPKKCCAAKMKDLDQMISLGACLPAGRVGPASGGMKN